MRIASLLLTFIFALVGCRTNTDDRWFSPDLAIETIGEVTVVSSSYALDGGTTSLFLISDEGNKCIVRLNQHQLDPSENPGRLYFYDE